MSKRRRQPKHGRPKAERKSVRLGKVWQHMLAKSTPLREWHEALVADWLQRREDKLRPDAEDEPGT
ncbi:MAG: hypothetical protein EOO70_03345 [Myxococcaceae bacterium]|nr:MAG: hypothetical protein EOO70_03345 [Myxococcaceae bacterium]